MELNPADPALITTLEAAIGHVSPFTVEECQALEGPLRVEYARDLSPLGHCRNVRQLEIFASDVETLDSLAGLESLLVLRVVCSTVRNVEALTTCRMLESVELVLNLVEDPRPLIQLPHLAHVSLTGNPLNTKSYAELRLALLGTRAMPWNKTPVVEISSERELRLAQALQNRGIPASFATIDVRPVLVAPGIPSIPNSSCDFLEIPLGFVEAAMLRPDFSIESLFDEYLDGQDLHSERRVFDFRSHFILGHSEDAASWVRSSSLAEYSMQSYLQFIRRFCKLTFYKEDDNVLDREEQIFRVRLPLWLRESRKTLTSVLPHEQVRVRFDSFDHWSAQEDSLSDAWYTFGLIGTRESTGPGVIEGDRLLFPIGEWLETGYSTLAINLADPEDQSVYEYDRQDLREEGRLVPGAVRVVFESYASLYSHIVALELENGEIIWGQ